MRRSGWRSTTADVTAGAPGPVEAKSLEFLDGSLDGSSRNQHLRHITMGYYGTKIDLMIFLSNSIVFEISLMGYGTYI